MKSILCIGAGRFGTHLIKRLNALGNEIMAVDKNETRIDEILSEVASAKIADCTNEVVLRSLDVASFDICYVCIGDNFQANLEITSLLKENGAKRVVSKCNKDIHEKFLLMCGADEVIYPDRDIAEKIAVAHSSDQVFDFIELANNYSIYEIIPPKDWVGKTIRQVDVRQQYKVNVIAVKNDDTIEMNPTPDYVFTHSEHVLVIGHRDVIAAIVRKDDM